MSWCVSVRWMRGYTGDDLAGILDSRQHPGGVEDVGYRSDAEGPIICARSPILDLSPHGPMGGIRKQRIFLHIQ